MAGGNGGSRRDRRRMSWALPVLVALLFTACAPGPLPAPTDNSSGDAVPTAPTPDARPTDGDPTEWAWPDADSTGVPEGTELVEWDEDCTISEPGTVIDARLVNCDLRIRTTDVVITRSRINGHVNVREPELGHSFSIADSEVHAGDRMVTGLGNGNFTATRVEVTGGMRSVNCAADCTIEHSWVHGQGQDPEGKAHLSGVRMGQHTTLRFNTIICEGARTPPGSGCSAALTGYGDFRPVTDNLIEGNFFLSGAASFCAFGGSTRDKPFSDDARNIRFIDNVFERDAEGTCGIHGPIVAFDVDAPGNLWENNVWSDGEPLPPRN